MPTSPSPSPVDTSLILPLPNNRQLAYAHSGPQDSRTILLFFPGIFSIAKCDDSPTFTSKHQYHTITISLPGWGLSSPRPKNKAYHLSLISDITALITHLHPDHSIDAIYIGGGSFGTVPAQMIYGAPFDLFPLGRKIKGMMLLSGFSPFFQHKGYASGLSWANYVAVGPPSRLPFHAAQRAFKGAMGGKFSNVDGAEGFIRDTLFTKMESEERGIMEGWLRGRGKSEEELVRGMAEACVLSVAVTWDGFMEVSDVLHSDWGFAPKELDREHTRPVLVVGCEKDDIGGAMNDWLGENYGAVVETVKGGHIGTLFVVEELWERLFDMAQREGRGTD